MITIRDIKVEKTFVDFKYWKSKYTTSLTLRLAGSFGDHKVELTDEQTAKVVEMIVDFAADNLTITHEADPAAPEEEVVPETRVEEAA